VRRIVSIGLPVAATAVVLIGCGSTSTRNSSLSELRTSGFALSSDLDSGHYASACDALTQRERATLTRQTATLTTHLTGPAEAEHLARLIVDHTGPLEGCVGFLEFASALASASNAHATIGRRFDRRLVGVLASVRIAGDIATYGGAVEARHEDGRWRFEGSGNQPPFEVPTIGVGAAAFFPPG
jgi:hypothetical protein